MPASLGELVLGWETQFRLVHFLDHSQPLRAHVPGLEPGRAGRPRPGPRGWSASGWRGPSSSTSRSARPSSGSASRPCTASILEKRPAAEVLGRARCARAIWTAPVGRRRARRPAAVRSTTTCRTTFYRLWLGPTMMYSSGRWADRQRAAASLEAADRRQDRCLRRVDRCAGAGRRVLDVGCGWGYTFCAGWSTHHGSPRAVGLTPSAAPVAVPRPAIPGPGVEPRLERWEDHEPDAPYDAIVSFGAFEHFAPDGSRGAGAQSPPTGRFFGAATTWLRPGGRLGLETIGHDDAPDTDAPLGRGPLGDVVLERLPGVDLPPPVRGRARVRALVRGRGARIGGGRLRPHDAALGSQPPGQRGRGRRARRRRTRSGAIWRYLVASDVQFRLDAITNYRVVLHRRPAPRW